MRVPGCEECTWLWEKYTDATFDFVIIDGRTKMAQLRQESLEAIAPLREGVAAAAQRRDVALARLKEHEVTHQMRAASAGF